MHAYIITCGYVSGSAAVLMDAPILGTLNKYFMKKRSFANSASFVGSGVGCLIIPVVLRASINTYTIRGAMFILSAVWFHTCIIGALCRPIRLQLTPDTVIKSADQATTNKDSCDSKTGERLRLESDAKCAPRAIETDKLPPVETPEQSSPNEPRQAVSQPMPEPDKTTMIGASKYARLLHALRAEFTDYKEFLQNPQLLRICLAITFGSFAYFNQLFLLPPIAKELGFAHYDAMLIALPGVAEICSRIPLGLLSDRAWIDKPLLVSSASATCCVLALLVTYTRWHVIWLVYAGLLGVVGGTIVPLALPMLTDCVRATRIGSATGLFIAAMGLALAVGPPLLGATRLRSVLYCFESKYKYF